MSAGSQGAALDSPAGAPPVPDLGLLRIRDLIYQVCGIFHPDNKAVLLHDRCLRRMNALGIRSFREYMDVLTARASREQEIRLLLNEITVGETCFFRCPAQLTALRKILLPRIASQTASVPRKFRIWSAGCSTGEEPYTLAIISLEEAAGPHGNLSWEIVATDLNDRSIARAEQGLYDAYALRNTEAYFVQKYFSPEAGKFQLSSQVRSRVTFDRLNLLDESKLRFMKGFDLIFCANVLIYFDAASKCLVIDRLYESLVPGGHFFLSPTESLFAIANRFHLVHFPGATGYLRPSNASAPPPPVPGVPAGIGK